MRQAAINIQFEQGANQLNIQNSNDHQSDYFNQKKFKRNIKGEDHFTQTFTPVQTSHTKRTFFENDQKSFKQHESFSR